MEKKAVSPLLAYVLLIALSVSMAFLVINWVIDIFDDIEPPTPELCEDIYLSLSGGVDYDFDNKWVEFNLTNDGYFSIRKISVSFDVGGQVEQWCNFLNIGDGYEGIKPGDTYNLHLDLGRYGNNSVCNLDDDQSNFEINEVGGIESMEAVPWIIFEDDVVNCNDRKLTII